MQDNLDIGGEKGTKPSCGDAAKIYYGKLKRGSIGIFIGSGFPSGGNNSARHNAQSERNCFSPTHIW